MTAHTPAIRLEDDWPRRFDYDRSQLLDVREVGVEHRDGVSIRDITFAGPLRPHIQAYLVAPGGDGPFAGVLFGHWFEPRAPNGNRTQFVDEAVRLARSGVVSLLIDMLFPWRASPSANDAAYDRNLVVQQIVELRRALDVLAARAGVDPQRLAFVGHDFSAMHGTLLAAIDPRPLAYVLMAGTPRFADWFLKYWPSYLEGEQREAYLRSMAAVDPIQFAGRAAPAALFFQFARRDFYVPEAIALDYFAAAGEPKRLEWYDAEHDLNDAARRDRLDWLGGRLGLASSPIAPAHNAGSPRPESD
jgi:dienelactone hydrolase